MLEASLDVRQAIKNSRLSGYQILIIVASLTAMFVDGYDVIVVSFAAPQISKEFNLNPSILGLVLAAAGAGQVLGGVISGWIADRAGRRPMIIVGLVVVSGGMLLSAAAPGPTTLIAARLVTGFGAGGLIPSVGTILNEYSNRRRYGLIMGLMFSSITIGAVIGGVITAPILAAQGWRAAFLLCGIVTFIIAVIALVAIPESLEFLVEKNTPRNQERVARILRRMGRSETFGATPAPGAAVPAERSKLVGRARGLALIAGAGFALTLVSYPFLILWTPQLLANVGAPELSVSAGLAVSLGGVVGSLSFAGLSRWVPIGTLAAIALGLGGIAMLVMGVTTGTPGVTVAIAAVASLFISAGVAGYYAMVPAMFPVETRALAFGLILSIGRVVGVASPIIGGALIATGAGLVTVGIVFAVPLLAATVLTLVLQNRSRAWNIIGQDLLDPERTRPLSEDDISAREA
ncbi:MFS transporter [Leifsonia sp. McL0607]|uniref:MFS transporter n=1 Tax=Leifsonia sp. McL0607 TaxID=3415672 RepID=UPI003CEB5BFF